MTWIVGGVLVMSSVFPLWMVVNYFHSQYTSFRGETIREKAHHREMSFITIAQLALLIGIAMFVWGVCDTYIKDEHIDTRQVKAKNFKYNLNPWTP